MISTEELFALLDARRAELGLSQAEVGRRAFGQADGSALQNIRRGSSPTFDKLQRLCAVLALKISVSGNIERVDGVAEGQRLSDDFAQIPLHEATLAAGCGAANGTEAVIGHLAFRKAWLKQIGTIATNAVLVRAEGASMAPTIHDNDILLIDRAKAEVPVRRVSSKSRRRPSIYALLHEGLARVKRIERPEEGLMLLTSDNPEFAPEILVGEKISSINIIGRVMWWGHTERE